MAVTESLPAEQEAAYSAIIDAILAAADLNTVSAKQIRKGLQDQVSYDITPQKAAITSLIVTRFDKAHDKHVNGTDVKAEHVDTVPDPASATNGVKAEIKAEDKAEVKAEIKAEVKAEVKGEDNAEIKAEIKAEDKAEAKAEVKAEIKAEDKSEDKAEVKAEADQTFTPTPSAISPNKRKADDESELSDPIDSPAPKKAKKSKRPGEEDDAAMAARLQAELNGRARTTRGGGKPRKPAKKEKKGKKKSSAKVKDDEDGGSVSNSSGEKPEQEKEKKGVFHKQYTLSPPLAALLDAPALSRPQTVKQIWQYVRAHTLQDPADKRQIRCDAAMRDVFKQERVHMFTMNKLLGPHFWALEE